ncbi:heparinase II/III domain-containing protein [Actinoplanes xinjiangensis]|uniref:Heparinase II/III-like protein n=1 Tax=Actinoplanes xinjiangensis TaxID=512350 RepID=A0A316FGS9_9ACTN|nr:heparinase II/III family protein [Actinoplanes xinjiangensis]PWK48014.1 heparinase II/III-like protein [Actinoplanes xinjiangensis]GIF39236.1 heparinase [Actinoplanes xinjiangensis]
MFVPPATDRPVWRSADEPTLRELSERARATLGTPWPTPLARDFARYFRDGDRDTYEQAIWGRHRRLARAVVLAAATLDPVWLDEVADGVTLFCEQSTWCWPAHDDTFTRHGSVLPTVTDPYVDLGAGEVAADLAWTDHVLGAPLDERFPGLRARIRHEVDRRVLRPFTERRDWHWLGLDGHVHNWNPWIHSNILIATSLLVTSPARREQLTGLVVEGIGRYAAAVPADGAIDEGYHYWWFGALRYLETLERLGRDLDPELIAFPHRVHLGGPWYLNHADGPARPSPHQPWHTLHRLARLAATRDTSATPETSSPARDASAGRDASAARHTSAARDAEAHAAAHRRPGEPVAHESHGLGYLLQAVVDQDWIAAVPAASPLPRDVWFPSTQVLLARPAAGGTAGLTLAVKGGHNGENHNHNDVGSFIVARDGVPVLIDPGRPTYTAQTFGPRRYEIWTMRSTWHNTPSIRGVEQAAGRSFAARDVVADVDAGSLTLDLAGAYPRDDVRRWVRTARLDRTTGTITIRDSWELLPGTGRTVLHLIAAGEVTLTGGGADIGGISVAWGDRPCTVTSRRLDDPLLTDVWGDRLTRLDIDVTTLGPVGTLELTVKERR